MATDNGPMVGEARTCETKSRTYQGACLNDRNCANVCLTEGFTGGHCKRLKRRCYCTKDCPTQPSTTA
ncbi:hypothetical protein U1Q18_002585 [Sarracenia purpurea var. burkii]